MQCMCSCFIGYGSVVERQLHFAFVSRRFNIYSQVVDCITVVLRWDCYCCWRKNIYFEENMNIMLDIAVCGTLYYMSERESFGCERWCQSAAHVYLRTQIIGVVVIRNILVCWWLHRQVMVPACSWSRQGNSVGLISRPLVCMDITCMLWTLLRYSYRISASLCLELARSSEWMVPGVTRLLEGEYVRIFNWLINEFY